jgi:hypothetical protein
VYRKFYTYEYKLGIYANTNFVFIHLKKKRKNRKKINREKTNRPEKTGEKNPNRKEKTGEKNKTNRNGKKREKNEKLARGASPPPLRTRHVSSCAGREARD